MLWVLASISAWILKTQKLQQKMQFLDWNVLLEVQLWLRIRIIFNSFYSCYECIVIWYCLVSLFYIWAEQQITETETNCQHKVAWKTTLSRASFSDLKNLKKTNVKKNHQITSVWKGLQNYLWGSGTPENLSQNHDSHMEQCYQRYQLIQKKAEQHLKLCRSQCTSWGQRSWPNNMKERNGH